MALLSRLDEEIAAGESVARFLRQSSYVAKTTGRIKHVAFLPAPDHDTSTFRADGLTQEELWRLAVHQVGGRAKNGAARFQANVVAEAGLKIEAEEPPERHANIRGWSMNEDPEMRKSERKTAAMILAEESRWDDWSAMRH